MPVGPWVLLSYKTPTCQLAGLKAACFVQDSWLDLMKMKKAASFLKDFNLGGGGHSVSAKLNLLNRKFNLSTIPSIV